MMAWACCCTCRDAQAARKVLHKAEGDRRRMVQLLKSKHPAGVVGVDSTANLESEVYGAVRGSSSDIGPAHPFGEAAY